MTNTPWVVDSVIKDGGKRYVCLVKLEEREVCVKVEGTTPPAPLASAWVYIQDGGTTTTYRTEPNGRLRNLAAGATAADAVRPWKFETKTLVKVPKPVRIYISKGARPIPQSVLDNTIFNNAHAYAERTIAIPDDSPPDTRVAEVVVPPINVALTQPGELSLCPVLWDNAPKSDSDDAKDYLRAGIAQGASTPAENSAPSQPPADVVVHERAVSFKGTIDNNAQHVRIRVFDSSGAVIGLRTTATGGRVEQIEVATTASGAQRVFATNIWFDDPTRAFGLVHMVVESYDVSEVRHHLDSFSVFLVGLQLAMVDDAMSNLNGATAGPLCNEAQERVVLDFKKSPCREVTSSNLFLLAHKVKKKQAEKVVNEKAIKIDRIKATFANLQKAHQTAATALATAVAQVTAAQSKIKLNEAKAKLAALRTAVNNAALTAKLTVALSDAPSRDPTGDPDFDAAMQELANALVAVNAALDPPGTQAITALTTALATAEQQVDEALTQVNIEISATAAPEAKAAAHTARTTATTEATTQLQTFETGRTTGQTTADNARNLLVAPNSAAKAALQHAETALAPLLADARKKANNELTGQRRARRMVRYVIRGDQTRKFGGSGPQVPHPQMPMFMAELQVFGVQKSSLEELLERRKKNVPPISGLAEPQSIRLEIDWRLQFKWKGPDIDPPAPPVPASFHDSNPAGYRLDQEFRGVWTSTNLQTIAQGVVLTIGDDNTLSVDGDAIKDAFNPVPVKLPFPCDSRRAPIVAITNRQRTWGRNSAAKSAAAMVVEWQVPVVDSANREILRGGDGFLTVAALTVDGRRIDRGTSATVASAPSDLQLVPFRVAGENVAANVLNTADPLGQAIDEVVAESYAALPADHVARNIDVAGWKLAYRRIVNHESGSRQFNSSISLDFRHWEGNMAWSYGQEKGMPLHGHPHGFTMAQIDPHPNDDAMWSYLDAIRAGLKILFEKAKIAKSDLEKAANVANQAYQAKVANGTVTPQDQNPAATLDLTIPKHREALLRAAVKRYNGGEEFVWGHPHGFVMPAPPAVPPPMSWVISPSIKNDYPNLALGTNVNYNQAEPIAFTQFVLPVAPATP